MNNNTDWTLNVVFSIFKGFFVHNNPKTEAQGNIYMPHRTGSLSCSSTRHARNSFGLLPQGYCERKTPKSWKNDIWCSICIVINQCMRRIISILQQNKLLSLLARNIKAKGAVRLDRNHTSIKENKKVLNLCNLIK